jgi:TonB-linked SusC/RagA family outer membrane protein
MKKKHLTALILLAMKITVVQLALSGLFTCSIYANKADAQGLLDKPVTISVFKKEIAKVITIIQKQTGVKFLYSPTAIQADRKISCTLTSKKLSEFIEQELKPLNIGYKIIGGQILLYSLDEERADAASAGSFALPSIDHTLTGVVTNEKDEPISGVSVVIKGSSNGTVTDRKGVFKLEAPDEHTVLIVSSIGYQTQEIMVGKMDNLVIRLVTVAGQLTDVIVVGYGVQKSKEVTSAITHVNSADFNKGNINNVAQLLQGKVAGLSIARAGGNPNEPFEIRLRGLSTVSANTGPLVVIDGAVGADLNSIDPNDIASVDVIKDGAGAAIYGTRGSAGVILITTKKGQSGKARIDYNGSASAEQVARAIPVASAAQYRKIMQQTTLGTDFGHNTDWIKAITQTAYSQIHNLSLSGGGPNSSYRASVNYRKGQGVEITTGYQQLNSSLNLNQRAFNDRLNLSFYFAQTTRSGDLGFDAAFKNAYTENPTASIYDTSAAAQLTYGGYSQPTEAQQYNPVALLRQNSNHLDVKSLNTNFQAEFEIVKGLKLMGHYATQSGDTINTIYFGSQSYFDTRPYYGSFPYQGLGSGGFGTKANNTAKTQLLESTLTYNIQPVSKLDATVLGGYSYQNFDNESFNVANGGFINDLLGANNLGAGLGLYNPTGAQAIIGSYKGTSKLIAFFGRLNLNYDNLVFVMASLRKEGSSEFGEGHKWGYFPAVSAGLDVARLIRIPAVNNLKFRASYGITGSLPPGPYLSLSTFAHQSTNFFYNGNWVSAYGPGRNANPDLKWENKTEVDLGFDFSLLKGRLNGSLDYYNRKTTDLLWYATVPEPPNLAPNTWKNFGELRSHGLEFALNYNVINTKDFKWTAGFNISTNRVRLISLADFNNNDTLFTLADLGAPSLNQNPQSSPIALWPGGNIGVIWGQTFRGVGPQGQWVVDSVSHGSGGKSKLSQIGNALPKFELAFSSNFSYKRWDLGFTLRGAFDYDLVNSYRAHYEIPQAIAGTNVVLTKYYLPALSSTAPPFFSSYQVENATYVKLDNATLGYTLQMPSASAFRMIRFYFSANNLFTITGYTGADPEIHYNDNSNNASAPNYSYSVDYSDVTTGGVLTPGIERRSSWARTRSFTFGINVGF